MTFIETNSGLINLAFVQRIRQTWDSKTHIRSATLYGGEGQLLGEVGYFNPDDLQQGTIVPASGITAMMVSIPTDNPTRPVLADLFICKKAVIAWRITTGDPEPIFCEETASNTKVFIIQPDGRYLQQYVGDYETEEAAIADLLTDLQRAYDNKHQAA